jgi:multiple sugar transport system ATP-binding protein
MNLVPGTIDNGTFAGENIAVSGVAARPGPVILGFRAEDAFIASGAGEIEAPVYSMELLGDSSMVSMRVAGELVAIKAPKEFRAEIGQTVRAGIPARACHYFDRDTGLRLAA